MSVRGQAESAEDGAPRLLLKVVLRQRGGREAVRVHRELIRRAAAGDAAVPELGPAAAGRGLLHVNLGGELGAAAGQEPVVA